MSSNKSSGQKIQLKKRKVYDEYILTNKHIICKFKYIVLCFDQPDDNSHVNGGLVNISRARLEELFTEQNVQLDSSQIDSVFGIAEKELKAWHPQICKVCIDCKTVQEIDGLDDNPKACAQILEYVSKLPGNNCIKSQEDFDKFKKFTHRIVDVKVHFSLIRKISKVEEYNVNFNYLHALLVEHINKWNQSSTCNLDEVSVTEDQLPFSKQLNYVPDDDDGICYVYPSVKFVPLYPPK